MAKGSSVERTRRAYVPDQAWLAKQAQEPILEPDLPIIDPHHHLWDHLNNRYLLDELLADTGSGHNITATVYIDCRSMYRGDGPAEMKPVGETEFANGVAAMSASGIYGPTRACAGIVSYVDMMLGARARAVLEAHVAAGNGRFRGIRHAGGWDASPDVRNSHTNPPQGLYGEAAYREGVAQLGALGLTYEAWQYHPQLKEVTALARAVPQTTMILNHCGGPLGIGPYAGKTDAVFATWKADMAELARCPNVVVKLGGLGMDIGVFDHMQRPRAALVARDRRRLEAVDRDLHQCLRRRALHVREQLPGRQAVDRLCRAVERLQADGGRRLGGREDGAVQRHGAARVSTAMSDWRLPPQTQIPLPR